MAGEGSKALEKHWRYAVLLWKIASMRLLGSLPEGQSLDIGLHDGVYRSR
jgi:hypothetical protein